jgi:hypothetical protein
MSKFLNRLDKIEKASRQGTDADKPAIKVTHLGHDDFEKRYALFQARLKLGLVGFDEKKCTIMVTTEEMEKRFEDLPTEQAKKIFKEHKDAA